jgi:hypothetical protein
MITAGRPAEDAQGYAKLGEATYMRILLTECGSGNASAAL